MSNIFQHFSQPCFFEDHIIGLLSLAICLGCFASIVSEKIDDGILGKIFIGIVALGAFSLFSKCISHSNAKTHISEITLLSGVMLYAFRELWNAYIVRRFKKWYYDTHPHKDRRLNCRGCWGTNVDGSKRCPNHIGDNNENQNRQAL